MEATITFLGWVLLGALTIILVFFALAAIYGVSHLGYCLATRMIKESRWWKKAVQEGNYQVTRHDAYIMRDRLGYGSSATLDDIIKDTEKKICRERRSTARV